MTVSESQNKKKSFVEKRESKEQLINPENFTATNDDANIAKKRRTKKKKKVTEGEKNEVFSDQNKEEQNKDENEDQGKSGEEENNKGRLVDKKNKRKKKKPQEGNAGDRIARALKKRKDDDDLLLCLIVHKVDQLKLDVRIQHPVIKIHLINIDTGQYIKKIDPTRNVTTLYENKNENVDYILPMMTQPYDIRKNRSMIPEWNETLIYNEVYSYFLEREPGDPPVIIFFELLDFVQMNLKQRDLFKTNNGWHRIAWAFLRLVSVTGSTNTDSKLRLQLYEPLTRFKTAEEESAGIEIYQWWKLGRRLKYPSTLYATAKGVLPPDKLHATTRSMFPLQHEKGGVSFEALNSSLEGQMSASDTEPVSASTWVKLPGQVNRIPNKLFLSLPAARKGCTVLQFSNDGKYLACACVTAEEYLIVIYAFPEGEIITSFSHHFGIVYSLCWSRNGRELLSASGDNTAKCWDTKRYTSSPIKLFPHPTFVYSAKYHPILQKLVISVSYDKIVRVWNKLSDGLHAVLIREFYGHLSYINSLTFDAEGTIMFTADGIGLLKQWDCYVGKKKRIDAVEAVHKWKLLNTHTINEIKGTPVNTIQLHAGGKKLLVHTRDSLLRMYDLRSSAIQKMYIGGENSKEYIHATLTPCGSFVFCGTETGMVNVWNTESGQLVHTYKDLSYLKAVSDVRFHPHDNYVAFCCYGSSQPIRIFVYDPKLHIEAKQATSKSQPSSLLLKSQQSLNEANLGYESMRNSLNPTPRINKAREILSHVQDNTTTASVGANVTRKGVTFHENLSLQQSVSPMKSYSTWGSEFTASPQPSYRLSSSPHAHLHLGASGRFYGGRSPTPVSPMPHGSMDMTLDDGALKYSDLQQPKPVFTFNTTKEAAKHSPPESFKKVISLYEYQPTRADELALQPNDVITVLYEDNANWWMGQLDDGQQGYFPANYVMESTGFESEPERKTASSHLAIVHKGSLKILSESENEDCKPKRRIRQKSKKHQKRSSQPTL